MGKGNEIEPGVMAVGHEALQPGGCVLPGHRARRHLPSGGERPRKRRVGRPAFGGTGGQQPVRLRKANAGAAVAPTNHGQQGHHHNLGGTAEEHHGAVPHGGKWGRGQAGKQQEQHEADDPDHRCPGAEHPHPGTHRSHNDADDDVHHRVR